MEDVYGFLIGVLLVVVSILVALFIGFQMPMLLLWGVGMIITFYYMVPKNWRECWGEQAKHE
jgi:hypothetical protein